MTKAEQDFLESVLVERNKLQSLLTEVVNNVRKEHFRFRGNSGQKVDAGVVADLLDMALAPVGGGKYEETRDALKGMK